jgi:acyl-CoA reductase-like NAD-dependent aldehyde dehydrogenase
MTVTTLDLASVGMFIDGQLRPALDDATAVDVNPATGETICEVAYGSLADLDAAVAAARRAHDVDGWPLLPAVQRARLLLAIADGIEARAEEMALRETLDVGKPIQFTRSFDVAAAASGFRYYAGMVEQLAGVAHRAGTSSLAYTRRESLGVVGAITPFNFPLNLAVNKIAPALAAGNTVVLKPAEQTPLSVLLLAEIMSDAGLPPGVFNVITGDGPQLGSAMSVHPGIDKIAFTGSTSVGKQLVAAAAGTLKRVTVELGGKGANIVFDDADLPAAVAAAFQAAFFNSGQFCMSGSRLLVQRGVYREMVDAISAAATAAAVGDPLDPSTMIGPLAHQAQFDRVEYYVALGKSEGATLTAGGAPGAGPNWDGRGFFYLPTVFADADPNMAIAQDEIFGPVLTVIPFDDEDEAIAIANGTPYGLAAGLHTCDLSRAHRVAARLQAGIVWVNTWAAFENSTSFGGYKQSGYGRELGPEGIEEYLQTKTVYVGLENAG